jgi:hypothetical protein
MLRRKKEKVVVSRIQSNQFAVMCMRLSSPVGGGRYFYRLALVNNCEPLAGRCGGERPSEEFMM